MNNNSDDDFDSVKLPVDLKYKFRDGDLVWAKEVICGEEYPWWPGKITLQMISLYFFNIS